ncbi:response regulator [Paenibacillus sp. JNUCC31]|uniref:response regulator n=1 Tax=Paenibacillus sp. JNUCC-31 TaxID=2777983 RepID=UPI001783A6BD|nr:response regulator [Paenibacillus sp. JNUCC-31]QOS77117.1 response regulator [Paenibacillus sp. JNUCC-31]
MLNILVVDDEPKHRRGLSRMLNALKPEYNIFHARDGEEALQNLNVHPMDLVFTDIQMPVMDGLELMEQLTRRGGNESVIILSAYSDFVYAQRALQLGASDYLLKPVEEQNILPLLAKAERKASTARLACIESALSELLEGCPSNQDYRLLESAFPEFKQGIVLTAVFGMAKDHPFLLSSLQDRLLKMMEKSGFSCAFCMKEQMLTALIMNSESSSMVTAGFEDKMQEVIQHFLRAYGAELTLGLGRYFAEWQEARQAYQQACHALKARFYKGGGVLYGAEQMNNGDRPAVVKLEVNGLTRAVLSGNKPEIEACLDSAVCQDSGNGFPEPEKLKYVLAASIDQVISLLMEKGLAPLHSRVYEEALLHCHTVDELKEAAREWIFELTDRLDQRRQCKAESIIDSCKAYIDTHYGDGDLSLSTLATKFHFNPSYFCMLFKTHSHMTVHQYIAHTRMKAAAGLLLQTSQKVYQIAESVGYKDAKYFIRLFRKEFGTSPEEYRHLSATL